MRKILKIEGKMPKTDDKVLKIGGKLSKDKGTCHRSRK